MITYCYNSLMADQVAGTHFGKRLKYFRRRRKLTQTDVATRLGVVPTTVVAWEKQPHPLKDPFQLSELADYLRISVGELTGQANIADIAGDDWETRDIRRLAPNTPVEEASGLLDDWEHLDQAGRRAVQILIDGLRKPKSKEGDALEG